ncbi:hypothetical protein KNP414_00462 [Paenibacillus mucilaginosus KNP414]|uniref:Uncharacterized protein n=1 Tax=Paenibacillus mucilaginosus (strain KNP414) TaxID=1036673 RepID=F8FPD7_PAEMK|nr:hypothetical protein KNP414_00462 [Paenibacillus mucilaginosus KNP414]
MASFLPRYQKMAKPPSLPARNASCKLAGLFNREKKGPETAMRFQAQL